MAEINQERPTPFLISDSGTDGPGSLPRKLALRGIERLLGLQRCQTLYEQLEPTCEPQDFPGLALQQLGVNYELSAHDRERIPESGPCILIANHPFGGVEGLVLLDLLARIRPDFKVMANFLLQRVPQLQPCLISVDPFAGATAARTNLAPLRQALNWLKQGGLLVIFPAGEVSSWQSGEQGVTDPPWSTTLARLVRLSKSPVLPVFFPGQNGPFFQWAGRIHPRLRTILLPRMLLNKRGRSLEVRVGHSIPAKKLADLGDDRQLNDYLRMRTYALGLNQARSTTTKNLKEGTKVPLADPPAAELLAAEIIQLRSRSLLLESGEFDVLLAEGEEAPNLLLEIGRLRELTFRRVGEGTGRNLDLDRFDADYSHLFIWNRENRELVGAYRIGRVDRLLTHKGAEGLYTTTLFDFQPQLLDRLRNALELGRSFIRPEYQRSYAQLLLLWKGIGHYLVANPQYRYLFGPVSISGDYSADSRQLMTSALSRHYLIDDLAKLVQPRLPVALKPLQIHGIPTRQSDPLLEDMDEISTLVADLETDSKGIPVLLRHYLSLGGKLLSFNLDPDFSDVIDGLLLVDLRQTERKQLQRYMGREGYQNYLANQQHAAQCA